MADERGDLHDRFLRKNQALSRAYEISKKDNIKEKQDKGEILPEMVACYRCKTIKPCRKHHITETGRHEGAVSVGHEVVFMCEDCAPKRKKSPDELSKKQIASLLRGAKRGRI
jgi:hypothetical protein